MSFSIDVSFPGGKKVDGHYNNFTVHTDQPKESGGNNTAPSPFELFFVSLATCAGFYALEFCQSRSLPTKGLTVNLKAEKTDKPKLYDAITVDLTLPKDFPQKYENAIKRSVDLCTVKRHIFSELNFDIKIV